MGGFECLVLRSPRTVCSYWSARRWFVRLPSLQTGFGLRRAAYSPATPPYFSYAAPFLLKQDIIVEDVLMSSGSLAGQAVSSGDIKLLLTTGAIAMQANMAGGDLVIIAGAVQQLPYQIVARPEIKTAADLRGKRVGISRFGSSSEWIIRIGLARLGLDADRDFAMIQTGGPGDRYLAMQSNTIQATLLAPPLTNLAVQKGMRELLDVSRLDVPYPLESVTTTRSFLQSNRPLLKRFLMGLPPRFTIIRTIRNRASRFRLSSSSSPANRRRSLTMHLPGSCTQTCTFRTVLCWIPQ